MKAHIRRNALENPGKSPLVLLTALKRFIESPPALPEVPFERRMLRIEQARKLLKRMEGSNLETLSLNGDEVSVLLVALYNLQIEIGSSVNPNQSIIEETQYFINVLSERHMC